MKKILRESGLSLRQLAEDAGINYGTLRHWVSGKRSAGPGDVERLAVGMERRAGILMKLAEKLRGGESF